MGFTPPVKKRPLFFCNDLMLIIVNNFRNQCCQPFHVNFSAPEILECRPITLSADIWSLGVCSYVLLTGFSPFGGDTDQETLYNITSAPLDFPPELFEGVSDMAKDFISDCLNRDPR